MDSATHLKPLTSLRFFAAAWVVLFHYWPALGQPTPALIEKGYLGVELFFVLSGFILCHVYLSQAGEGGFSYRKFLWARLARVYPLHLATLIGVGLMGLGALAIGAAVDPNVLSLQALPANLLMVHAWGLSPVAGWNHPSWSISAEWFAYLAFPAFAWGAWRLRNRPQVALAGALVFIFTLYAVFQGVAGFPLTRATIAWGALRIVPCFAFGCAVYLAWKAGATDRRWLAWTAVTASLAGIIGFAILDVQDAIIVSLFGLLILGLAGLSKGTVPILANPFCVWLGEVSYAVYMVCIPWSLLFLHLAPRVWRVSADRLPLTLWLVLVGMVVPLAAIAHHLIERPARDALKRLKFPLHGEKQSERVA